MTSASPPQLSVVIPTYQRKALVVAAVRALGRQVDAPPFEIIVVVDGSSDGTATALRALDSSIELTVIEQRNSGAAAARNAGARIARGQTLVFLDDDMMADVGMLAEHQRSHEEGADVVLGHFPLHEGSPVNLLSRNVAAWTDGRLRRLSQPDATLTMHDLLTGQLSVSRGAFADVGGFDQSFTRGGLFGGEDLDFGVRLLAAGRRIDFNAAAISSQHYVVDPADYLRQWRGAGRSDVELMRKHPDRAGEIMRLSGVGSRGSRRLWRPLLSVPRLGRATAVAVGRVAAPRVRRGAHDGLTRRLFDVARTLAYLQGAREAGGLPKVGRVLVLAYRGVSERASDPITACYTVRPGELDRQLRMLRRLSYRFLGLDDLVDGLTGRRPMPTRGVLVTFDDCYENLLHVALPILSRHRVPAVAFAVSRRMGATNVWDRELGADPEPLLDGEGLRLLASRGIEIGAHSQTHPLLTELPLADIDAEIAGSIGDLEAACLPRPRAFAYPYGEHSTVVVDAVRRARCAVAFTVSPGVVRSDTDPHLLPRFEMRRGDTGGRLLIGFAARAARRVARRGLSRLRRGHLG